MIPVAAKQGVPVYNVGTDKSASPDVSVGAFGEWLLQAFNVGPAPATKDLPEPYPRCRTGG